MKTRYKIIGITIAFSFALTAFITSFPFQSEFTSVSLQEVEKMYENTKVTMHFQSAYPSYSTEMGIIDASQRSYFWYIAVNEDKIAQLRTMIDFNKEPQFTYMCQDLGTGQTSVKIEHASNKDIDNNRCW